jgi:hypothetical protein
MALRRDGLMVEMNFRCNEKVKPVIQTAFDLAGT